MKRLVVCSDGTWNTRENTMEGGVTNVVKVARLVAATAGDGTTQVVFYDPGVGTAGSPWDRIIGGITGAGLSKNVADAYQFLVDNYEPGDQVFLFGFSRGAYTVRSTVGLIRKCGLLRKDEAHRFQEAYRFYRGDKHPDSEEAKAFRAKHSREITIRFLGVWDTVGALGIPLTGLRSLTARRYQFHDVALSKIVEHACHAVAIDERRKSFEPTLWSTKQVPGQIVEQVWFAGAHSGVGGGYQKTGLSDVALQWMKERAASAGLEFDEAAASLIIHPDPNAVLVDSRSGVWSLLPGEWRRIGDSAHQPQSVHASALSRLGHPRVRYQPPNLVAYLRDSAGPGSVAQPMVAPSGIEAR